MLSEASKRPRITDNNDTTENSRCKVIFTPLRIGAVENADEIDKKILIVQNRKLTERQRTWKKLEQRLREKISRLEHQRLLDDSRLTIIDQYWDQLHRNVQNALSRLEKFRPIHEHNESSTNHETSFLITLASNHDRESIDDSMRLKTESVTVLIDQLCGVMEKFFGADDKESKQNLKDIKNEIHCDNCDTLQKCYHASQNKLRELENLCSTQSRDLENKQSQIEDLEFESEKWFIKEAKLQSALIETQTLTLQSNKSITNSTNNTAQSEELKRVTELSEARLCELNDYIDKYQKITEQVNELQLKLSSVPVNSILDSVEFKSLQNEYKIALEDREKMYKTVNEVKSILHYQKQAYDSQLASIEKDEMVKQRNLKNELTTIQTNLLAVEFEKDKLTTELDTYRLHKADNSENILNDVKVMQETMNNYVQRLKRERNQYRKEVLHERHEKEKIWKSLNSNENGKSLDCAVKKKLQALEDILKSVRSELKLSKEQEDILINELEATGLAFEEMHEKNRKLLSLLAERESINFRLITEGVHRNKCIELLTEQKKLIENDLNLSIRTELDLSNQLTNDQNKRIVGLERSQAELEAQMHLSIETSERNKLRLADLERKESEFKEINECLRSELEKLRTLLSQNNGELERKTFCARRLEEDNKRLEHKCNSSIVKNESEDMQILHLEIEELRDSMKCSSCHTRSLDTIISKCFHVFCRECLKARLESRQRKCPRCNAAFGANDVHRIYLYST